MVGFLYQGTPSEFVRMLPLYSLAYRVPFCIISDDAIRQMVAGDQATVSVWDGFVFSEAVSELPEVIDCVGKLDGISSRKHFGDAFVDQLLDASYVLSQKSLNKYVLMKAMLMSDLSLYTIPSIDATDFQTICDHIKQFPRALIKPANGRQGIGVCKITNLDGQLTVKTVDGTVPFSEAFFFDYFSNLKLNNMEKILVQPCFDFRLDDKHSVDFRLLRHRGRQGTWEEVATYARIGATDVVSNLHQGGYVGNAIDIIRKIAGEKADSLYEEIMMLGEKVPKLIQQFRGEQVFCIGLDVAIDRETLRPFVLEANTYPGTRFHACQLAEKRVQFYQYVLDCLT